MLGPRTSPRQRTGGFMIFAVWGLVRSWVAPGHQQCFLVTGGKYLSSAFLLSTSSAPHTRPHSAAALPASTAQLSKMAVTMSSPVATSAATTLSAGDPLTARPASAAVTTVPPPAWPSFVPPVISVAVPNVWWSALPRPPAVQGQRLPESPPPHPPPPPPPRQLPRLLPPLPWTQPPLR